jgi:thymidylate synthase (FAD)
MNIIEPSVHIIGETTLVVDGLHNMLVELGVGKWEPRRGEEDPIIPSEILIEVAGRMCYLSFDPSLNDNLTGDSGKTTGKYIETSIIGNKHGSVLEHATVTVAFLNVSRVFTHEQVRHRVGVAYSQTSMRYVRSKSWNWFIPSCISDSESWLSAKFVGALRTVETVYNDLVDSCEFDKMDMKRKKTITSALRRLIGTGVATNIVCTFNHRALRWQMEERTSPAAEEEIRMVWGMLYDQVKKRYPHIYNDAIIEEHDGLRHIRFSNRKV